MRAEYRGTAVAVRLHYSELSAAAHGGGVKRDRRHSAQRRTSIIAMPAVAVWGALGSMSWKKTADRSPADSSSPSRAGSTAAGALEGSDSLKKPVLDPNRLGRTGWDGEGAYDCEQPERPELAGGNGKVSRIEKASEGVWEVRALRGVWVREHVPGGGRRGGNGAVEKGQGWGWPGKKKEGGAGSGEVER